RIGLSATISNKIEVARFLAGEKRQVGIADAGYVEKTARYRTEMPESDSEDLKKAGELFVSPTLLPRLQRISDLISSHGSTLLFVNSRTNAEYLATKLAALGTNIGVHHGSLPREERERVEENFKKGTISAMVCTSTLELGIDIGSVDLVIQYMSPRQVSAMIQRVGRSGHSLSRSSEGITIAVTPEDALESIVVSKLSERKELEPTTVHMCPLDVLCHQISGLVLESREVTFENVLEISRAAYPFSNLGNGELSSVLKFMETLGFVRLEGNRIAGRRKCRQYYLENLSMIPDERRYYVIDAATQEKVGILGEEFMMLHAEVGVNFVIKGRAWKIESIQGETVHVTQVHDPTASVPGWDGELLPIPEGTAKAVAKERRRIAPIVEDERTLDFTREWNADKNARSKVLEEILNQKASCVPTDSTIVLERWKHYLIIHTSAGERINLTLGEFFEEILLRRGLIRHFWNDGYRILVELTSEEVTNEEIVSLLFQYDESKRGLLDAVIRKHFPFGYYMKFIAERFGALKRGLMISGESLKELTIRFRFTPVYEETLREALMSKVDISGAIELLRNCSEGITRVEIVSVNEPSPLAKYILSRYTEMEEYETPGGTTFDSMKSAIAKEILSLLCFKCGFFEEYIRVESIKDPPLCSQCHSGLVAPIFYSGGFARDALLKWLAGKNLKDEEKAILTKSRRAADVVLSYGKAGIIAQCVRGVGPQTASKVLSKMHTTEEGLYEDLLEAKLNFIRTRDYWD
ncbi:MAG TPA: helicase-related protein, partial [Nitrososphaerales archaeon]|nr:helicase-related protein [Nitrososphaerales archaeon]